MKASRSFLGVFGLGVASASIFLNWDRLISGSQEKDSFGTSSNPVQPENISAGGQDFSEANSVSNNNSLTANENPGQYDVTHAAQNNLTEPASSRPPAPFPKKSGPFSAKQVAGFERALSKILDENVSDKDPQELQTFFRSLGVEFRPTEHRVMGANLRSHRLGKGGQVFSNVMFRHVRNADDNSRLLESIGFSLVGGSEALAYSVQKIKSAFPTKRFALADEQPTFLHLSSEEGFSLLAMWVPTGADGEPLDAGAVSLDDVDSASFGPGLITVTLTRDQLHL